MSNKITEQCRPYTFFRKEGFYPLELRDDEDAKRNAECNPGTVRVEDINGNVVWAEKTMNHHGPFFHVTQNEKDLCEVCQRQRADDSNESGRARAYPQ